jgi:5-methyltetrahydropteroyltriglutamate--homocysteine methyltransferase
MLIPTEPIGSIPRPGELLDVQKKFHNGSASIVELTDAYDIALEETVKRFEATGSPVISDGEQRKPSFATYPLEGLSNIADDGVVIQFEDDSV